MPTHYCPPRELGFNTLDEFVSLQGQNGAQAGKPEMILAVQNHGLVYPSGDSGKLSLRGDEKA